jgi:dimethylhistidine N-methyltransferase
MSQTTFQDDVRAGLRANPKTLPCKYLYDARGSELFDQICEVDDYYVTRADLEATRENIEEIATKLCPADAPLTRLVELGSGSGTKTRVLLDHMQSLHSYVPVEISAAALNGSVAVLQEAYPHLNVAPLCADYTERIALPGSDAARTVVYFPGSTIGNFHRPDAIAFLRRVRTLVEPDGGVLIGADAKKDTAVLERAYNDTAGVTAAFNLNLLVRINRELGANFDLDAFSHRARYDDELGRIEMLLVSQSAQHVDIGGERFSFEAGETIRTEESYKHSREEFARLAAVAGLSMDSAWSDGRQLFSLYWLTPAAT